MIHCASAAILGLGFMLEGSSRWYHAQPSGKSYGMPAKAAEGAGPLSLTHCSLLLKIQEQAEISGGLCQFGVLTCWSSGKDATGTAMSGRGTSIGANKPFNHSHHYPLRLQGRALILTCCTTQVLAQDPQRSVGVTVVPRWGTGYEKNILRYSDWKPKAQPKAEAHRHTLGLLAG